MEIEEVKERYLIKAEENGTNDNISTDNYRFCLIFNESQNKYQTLHLQNRGVDDIRYIQKFLILDKPIEPYNIVEKKVNFKKPDNYFDLASARAIASKKNCKDYINLVEAQTENINQLLNNENYKPSFEWRESLFTVNSDLLSVYTTDFTIDKLLLNYYRYPNQIRLEDPTNPESGFDSTSKIEWDEKSIDDIVSLMVFNYDINQNNQRFQLNQLRTQK